MKLMNGIIRPGIILQVLPGGVIKASAPGLFSNKDNVNNLPPIMPFFKEHNNSYSEPKELDEVWIMNFDDNPLQLYWFRKDKTNKNNESILTADAKNVEVLCNRESGVGWASLYFTDGTGWIIKNDDSIILIDKKGDIILGINMPHRTIKIDDSAIHLGNKNEHPAVHGDTLLSLLLKIIGTLELIQKASLTTPFTAPIGAAITVPVMNLKLEAPAILSDHVKLD